MTTSWVETKICSPLWFGPPMTMPPPGAVCPAMVRYGLETWARDRNVITPDTRKTQVRGPEASMHARRLPVPESFKLVTSITAPPLPPTAAAPPPCASGNAGQCEPLHDAVVGPGFGVTDTEAEADLLESALLVA